MNIEIIFKIAGVGLVTAAINYVLEKADKKEIATLVTLAGLVIVLAMVLELVGNLFGSLRSIFLLF